jgi:hypothetical protein
MPLRRARRPGSFLLDELAEVRAGGAYAHSALALDTIARDKTEKASDRKVAGVPGADPKTNVRSAG